MAATAAVRAPACSGGGGGGGGGSGCFGYRYKIANGRESGDGKGGGKSDWVQGWLKHSIPTGLSVTKAANILEMLRGNEVRCGNEAAIHVCNNCIAIHCVSMCNEK